MKCCYVVKNQHCSVDAATFHTFLFIVFSRGLLVNKYCLYIGFVHVLKMWCLDLNLYVECFSV